MIIEVPAEVKQEVLVNVHIDDVIVQINKMKIEVRFNYIAKMMNEIYTKDLANMTPEQKTIVTGYLQRQLDRFSKTVK